MKDQNSSKFTGTVIKSISRMVGNSPVMTITLKVSTAALDSKGELYDRVDFPSIVLWDDLARKVSKGDQIEVEARFQTRKYKQGQETRYVSEFIANSAQLTAPS